MEPKYKLAGPTQDQFHIFPRSRGSQKALCGCGYESSLQTAGERMDEIDLRTLAVGFRRHLCPQCIAKLS